MTLEHKVETVCTLDTHVYSHLDPMGTIWMKAVHVYGHLELDVVVVATSGDVLAVGGGGMWRR